MPLFKGHKRLIVIKRRMHQSRVNDPLSIPELVP